MASSEVSTLTMARLAGLLYLTIIICGMFSEVYVRGTLYVANDAAATAANITAQPGLFRLGFAADALMLLSDVAIAVLFYILLRPVSEPLALAAAAFRLTQAAVLGVNLLNYYAALMVLGGAGFSLSLAPEQLNEMALLFLKLHGHGYDVGLLFFGVSSAILGYLLTRSARFPSLLGYGLMAAAAVYLLGSGARFLFPDLLTAITPLYIIPLVAELAFCLWLLFRGVRAESS